MRTPTDIAGTRLLDLSERVQRRRDLGPGEASVTALLLVRRAQALVRGDVAGHRARSLADAWRALAPGHPLTAVYVEAAAICDGMEVR